MSENISNLTQQAKDKATEVIDQVTPDQPSGDEQTAGTAVRTDADEATQKASDIDAGDVDEDLIGRQG